MRGATRNSAGFWKHTNFNPRSPCGERRRMESLVYLSNIFQSTLPLRGATNMLLEIVRTFKFQSTLPLRGATGNIPNVLCSSKISIHAPLAGSDSATSRPCNWPTYFNPRSPCGERLVQTTWGAGEVTFQSTLPLRGATCYHSSVTGSMLFQSTLPLRGATISDLHAVRRIGISIHAPLAGSDCR